MVNPEYRIFGDNLIEIEWFRSLSPKLTNADSQKIGPRGTNPKFVDLLIEYDRPDIILLADGEPVLVVEKTREVPTGHNVGQRVARLVRAVELGIPTIKFFPFDARKHGDYSSVCNLNIRLLAAFKRMREIHGAPVMAINWPSDRHGELIDDGSENHKIQSIVHEYLGTNHNANSRGIAAHLQETEKEYKRRLAAFPKYARYPGNSVYPLSTKDVLAQAAHISNSSGVASIRATSKSLIYEIGMTPDKCRREDPYTGTQFIYDYIWCRSGPERSQKHTNLILRFPNIPRSRWQKANPNDKGRKSSNWYISASALWFQDGLELIP